MIEKAIILKTMPSELIDGFDVFLLSTRGINDVPEPKMIIVRTLVLDARFARSLNPIISLIITTINNKQVIKNDIFFRVSKPALLADFGLE